MRLLNKILGICLIVAGISGCKGSDANQSTDVEIEIQLVDSIASTDTLAVECDSTYTDTIAVDTLVGKIKDDVEALVTKHKKTITLYEVEFCPISVDNGMERFIKKELRDDWRTLFEAFYLNLCRGGFYVEPYSRYHRYKTDFDYSEFIGYARIDGMLFLIKDESDGNFKNYILTRRNPIQFTLQWTVDKTRVLFDDNYEVEINADYGDLPSCDADSIQNDSFPGFWSVVNQEYI